MRRYESSKHRNDIKRYQSISNDMNRQNINKAQFFVETNVLNKIIGISCSNCIKKITVKS